MLTDDVDGIGGVETERALLYLRLVLAALPQAARTHLEGLMATGTFDYQSEFTERLRAEGRADGVLHVLRVRGIEVPDVVRERITGCSDLEQLDRWLERAITAASAHDLMV